MKLLKIKSEGRGYRPSPILIIEYKDFLPRRKVNVDRLRGYRFNRIIVEEDRLGEFVEYLTLLVNGKPDPDTPEWMHIIAPKISVGNKVFATIEAEYNVDEIHSRHNDLNKMQ